MLANFKVVKEDGVEIDGVEFAVGELMELDTESTEVSDLLAEGSIEAVESEDEDSDEDEEEETAKEDGMEDDDSGDVDDTAEVAGPTFDGQKIVGEVVETETNGVLYKEFSVEGGATFKIPVAEFEAKQ